ncbi:MAG: entericidin A/B family lipoprotein [Candidatus Accumulibacter sp.]|nr:entericidin A/B family lipoprotein [Accumulibacter sp.]
MKRFSFIALLIAAAALATTACNTVQGIGKDVERGGQAIEKAATK